MVRMLVLAALALAVQLLAQLVQRKPVVQRVALLMRRLVVVVVVREPREKMVRER
ncbi:hypothetical protein [Bradyrhizobium sp.]